MTTNDYSADRQRFLDYWFQPNDFVSIRSIEVFTKTEKRCARLIPHATQCMPLGMTLVNHIADAANKEMANVFFGVCPREGAGEEWEFAWQIRQLIGFFADLDNCDWTTAWRRCKAAGLPRPSTTIDSGYGVHLYWKLAQRFTIADAGESFAVKTEWVDGVGADVGKRVKRLYRFLGTQKEYLTRATMPRLSPAGQWLQDINQGIAAAIDGDHTHDLARILRLPGTMNRKDQRNGRIPLWSKLVDLQPGTLYDISEFSRFAEANPQRKRRELAKQMPLPKPSKRIPKNKREHLNELIAACAMADVGQRSERDFDLCAYSIKSGIERHEIWSMVSGVGKFAERGEEYFTATWDRATEEVQNWILNKQEKKQTKVNSQSVSPTMTTQPLPEWVAVDSTTEGGGTAAATESTLPPITNAVIEGDEIEPLPMREVLAGTLERTDNWPRRVGSALFIHDARGVFWLKNPSALFGWLNTHTGVIDWHNLRGCVTKDEVFYELNRAATRYEAIETYSHEPLIDGHYYACDPPQKGGDGAVVDAFLDFFSFDTPLDRQLAYAGLLTAVWGGPGGKRPIFLVTAKDRAHGKSTVPQSIARIFGGAMEFRNNEDESQILQRLLSVEAMSYRICLLDNVKSHKFSWGFLEGLATAPHISGKRMYFGDGRRPNTISWWITLNGPGLSRDLASRVLVLEVAKPRWDPQWERRLMQFTEDHREAMIGDLVAALRRPPVVELAKGTRWSIWDGDVLSRVPQANELVQLIEARQGEVDSDAGEARSMQDEFKHRLKELGYDTEKCSIFIPNDIANRWHNEISRQNNTIHMTTKLLKQAISSCAIKRMRRTESHGKGFIWVGKIKRPIVKNLAEKIKETEYFKKSRKNSGDFLP